MQMSSFKLTKATTIFTVIFPFLLATTTWPECWLRRELAQGGQKLKLFDTKFKQGTWIRGCAWGTGRAQWKTPKIHAVSIQCSYWPKIKKNRFLTIWQFLSYVTMTSEFDRRKKNFLRANHLLNWNLSALKITFACPTSRSDNHSGNIVLQRKYPRVE